MIKGYGMIRAINVFRVFVQMIITLSLSSSLALPRPCCFWRRCANFLLCNARLLDRPYPAWYLGYHRVVNAQYWYCITYTFLYLLTPWFCWFHNCRTPVVIHYRQNWHHRRSHILGLRSLMERTAKETLPLAVSHLFVILKYGRAAAFYFWGVWGVLAPQERANLPCRPYQFV